ncbi:chemotaxis protein CheW [Gloeobacter kilaueensis]|uniref:CheW protein n=1 Tax=Gloeobacter kilaueensis (strain ATCC BAA-2537 / CCAP 1431/1 / ULC 316 / JS1) TaxID=1183438 RepID=U5QJ92_GLOK1|nr:chemotaxis protein CheW [Gloeobacter kilaueensis]AGY58981.1 CheW protein [Gloeobacter kilaueensis JS1]
MKVLAPATGQAYLTFDLGGSGRYALAASVVCEVIELAACQVTTLPGTPAAVVGIFGRDGELFWLIDPAGPLEGRLITAQRSCWPAIVVNEPAGGRFALAVNAVEAVVSLAAGRSILEPPALLALCCRPD